MMSIGISIAGHALLKTITSKDCYKGKILKRTKINTEQLSLTQFNQLMKSVNLARIIFYHN